MLCHFGFKVFGDLEHENPIHTIEEEDLQSDTDVVEYINNQLSKQTIIVYCEAALI